MLSLLCKKHPLFRPIDDAEALGQIAVLMGSDPLISLAKEEGHFLDMKPTFPGVDLIKLALVSRDGIERLESTSASTCYACSVLVYGNRDTKLCICKKSTEESKKSMSEDERVAFEVLSRALLVNPRDRYTAEMLVSQL